MWYQQATLWSTNVEKDHNSQNDYYNDHTREWRQISRAELLFFESIFVHLHLQSYGKHLNFFFVCNSKRMKNPNLNFFFVCNSKRMKNPYVEMYMMNNNWCKECDSLVIEGKKVLQWHCKTMQEMKFENYILFKCDSSWSMNEFVGKHYDKVPQYNWINL